MMKRGWEAPVEDVVGKHWSIGGGGGRDHGSGSESGGNGGEGQV